MHATLRKEWQLAFTRSFPLLISTTILGLVFGTLAVAGGLSILDGLAMSGLVYSGAAQFVALQLMPSPAGLIAILATTFFLSLRFLLYALALLDDIKDLPLKYRIFLAFGMIDAVFVLVKTRYGEEGSVEAKHTYFSACVILFYVVWVGGTVLGLFLGDRLAAYNEPLGLEFFSYATFVTMLVPYLSARKNLFVALLALLIYLATWSAPYNLGIVIACVIAPVIVQLVIERVASKRDRGL